jgi:hypothetical protein
MPNFIVICKLDEGRYTQVRSEGFDTLEKARNYAKSINPDRDPRIVDLRTRTERMWMQDQIENFLRQETNMMDDACKRLASTLFKKNILNTIINCYPDDYTDRAD